MTLMADLSRFEDINPFVRMMRVKKDLSLSGKWRDIDHVFTYIASGSADFIVEGIRYPLKMGDAIIIPPMMTHVIVSNEKETFVQYIMHFDFYDTEERRKLIHKDVLEADERNISIPACEKLLYDKVMVAKIPEKERNYLTGRYLHLMKEFEGDKPVRNLLLKAECMNLLVVMLRNSVELDEIQKLDEEQKKAWIHIEKAIEYIMAADFSGRLDNETIALAIGVSPNYLTKLFRKHLGIPLHKYVMNVRVEYAQHLLLKGEVNVTEAANMCGFSSIHVFSKSFKSLLGISPSKFQEKIVNKENIFENLVEEGGSIDVD